MEAVALLTMGSMAGLEGEQLQGGAGFFRWFKGKIRDIQAWNEFIQVASVDI